MAGTAKCDALAEKYPDVVVLQLRGRFYNAYGDAAVVLSHVTGYKLRRSAGGRPECGFPSEVLDRNIHVLKKNRLGYVVMDGEDVKCSSLPEDNAPFQTLLRISPKPSAHPGSAEKPPGAEELVTISFRCPGALAQKLRAKAREDWQRSFDAIVVGYIEKGMRE